MADLQELRLSLLPLQGEMLSTTIPAYAADILSDHLKDVRKILPPEAKEVRVLCTHLRPHLDEYMAMLLFRAALNPEQHSLPLKEMVLTDANHDPEACRLWSEAAVFGLGGVQSGGAHPLLLFDEHVQSGQSLRETSATAVVTGTLFGRARLPKALFHLLREIDLVDACGGAHPKHLANYTLRLHDCAESGGGKPDSDEKRAVVEACLMALLRAQDKEVPFWQDSFWRERALSSLKQHAHISPLRQQNGFEQALNLILHNLGSFRQPRFLNRPEKNNYLSFSSNGPIFQTILVPFLAALCPQVWGEEIGEKVMAVLWNARILTQMRYTQTLQALEEHFGSEPEDGSVETAIGRISFKNVRTHTGNAGMSPWILEVQPKPGMSNVRQALISFVRKHHADTALTILRNTENGSLVVSRGQGIPEEQWNALVNWLVEWEGSSDTEGNPGCWHIVTSANGSRADFILNGNAAHRYVPASQLNVDILAEWVRTHPCPQ